MYDLLTAAQCLKQLENKDGIKYSKSYFSQMVSDGKIPFHSKQNSPKKFFKYEEVRQSIDDSKDPTRDAQREANDKKRSEPVTLLDMAGTYASEADISPTERLEISRLKQEAEEAKREAIAAGALEEQDTIWKSSVPETVTQAAAKAEKEYWLGRKAELDFKKMNQELVSVDDVKRQAFEIARGVRDTILAIPARLAPILAADNDAFSIQNKLTIEINSALESLSE